MKRHSSWIIGGLICAYFLFPSIAAAQELFFHWGDVGGNQELLSLGGYPADQNPDDRLSSGGTAQPTQSFFDKIREWYIKAEKNDSAGAGFYVSSDPLDSRVYGPDLLIVEIQPLNGAPLKQFIPKEEGSSQVKKNSDQALESGDFSALAPISKYTTSYYVLSRPLTQTEAAKLRITFHPPTAEDVDRIWKRATEGRPPIEVLPLLSDLAREIQNNADRSNEYKTSRRTDIFLHRLFFDRGFELLTRTDFMPAIIEQQTGADVPNPLDVLPTEKLQTILEVYRKTIPNDPKTVELYRTWIRTLKDNPFALSGSDNTSRLLADALALLPPSERLEHADWILHALPIHNMAKNIEDCLRIFDAFPATLSDSLRTAWLQELRNTADSGEFFELKKHDRTIPLITKHLGAETAARVVQKDYGNFLNFVWTTYNSNDTETRSALRQLGMPFFKTQQYPGFSIRRASFSRHLSPRNTVMEFTDKTLSTLRFIGPDQPDQLESIILKGISSAQTAGSPELRCSAIYPALVYAYETHDLPGHQRLVDFINNQIAAHYTQNENITPFAFLFENLAAHGWTMKELTDFTRSTLRDYPALTANIWQGLETLSKQTPQKAAWAQLLNEVSDSIRARGLDFEITLRYQHLTQDLSAAEKEQISLDSFRTAMKNSLENIPGSRDYSALSRLFAFINPLSMSRNTLTTFNGKDLVPVWEEITSLVWLHRKASSNHTLPVTHLARSEFPSKLEAAQQALGAALTFAIPARAESVLTRNAFFSVAAFTTEEWNQLDLESSRPELEKFFRIDKTATYIMLQTRSKTQLADVFKDHAACARFDFKKAVIDLIDDETTDNSNPIARAAKILYLVDKLQPFDLGNENDLARLWATLELVQAGLPIPVGLPASTVFMTEKQIELEVRKAVRLGRFWKEMITKAQAEGVTPNKFFEDVFRGSALEGLLMIDPTETTELERHVRWLETLHTPPAWAKDFAVEAKAELERLGHADSGKGNPTIARTVALDQLWKRFKTEHAPEIARSMRPKILHSLAAATSRFCRDLLGGIRGR